MREIIEQLEPKPLECVWELTLRCNLSCIHCGSAAGRAREQELTTEEALRLVRDLAAEGCQLIALSGGEPLVRPDWDVIAAECSRCSIEVRLLSNGWSFDDETARRGLAAGLSIVSFSLDGDEATHDFLRDRQGSHARVVTSIETAQHAGLHPVAITQVNRHNLGQLDQIYELLQRLGVESWQIQMTHSWGRASAEIQIRPQEAWVVHDFVVEKLAAGGAPRVFPGDDIGYYTPAEPQLRSVNQLGNKGTELWLGCYAGVLAVGIESNGNVKGCLSMPPMFVEGNVRERPFGEIWHGRDAFAYNRRPTPAALRGACGSCDMNEFCRGGCKSMGAVDRSSFEYPYCLLNVERDGGPGQREPTAD